MRRYLLSSVAALVLGIGAASAADLASAPSPTYTKGPVAVPAPFSWTGFYGGLNAGGVWGRNGDPTLAVSDGAWFGTFGPPFIAAAGSQPFNNSGFTGGGQIGYNWQWNSVVLGLESDFDYFHPRGSLVTNSSFPVTTTFSVTDSSSADWLFTLRPRVGVALNNWLLYGTGGLAVSHLKFNEVFAGSSLGGASSEALSLAQNKAGWTAGAGVEYALNRNWTIGAQYLYLQFDGISGTSSLCAPLPGCTSTPNHVFSQQSGSFREELVRGTINYKLN